MASIEEQVREKMGSDHKYACVWGCKNDVVAVDMPRVTCCKSCYVKLKKEKPEVAKRLQTWAEFISDRSAPSQDGGST